MAETSSPRPRLPYTPSRAMKLQYAVIDHSELLNDRVKVGDVDFVIIHVSFGWLPTSWPPHKSGAAEH